jgi:hypothetical protein
MRAESLKACSGGRKSSSAWRGAQCSEQEGAGEQQQARQGKKVQNGTWEHDFPDVGSAQQHGTPAVCPPLHGRKKTRHEAWFFFSAECDYSAVGASSADADFRTVEQFDEGHRCIVANAEAHLQDTQCSRRYGA